VINSHTQVTTRIDEELADLTLHHDALDQGTWAGFIRVDQDLEALDQRINRRCAECEKTENELRIAEGRIDVLTTRVASQREIIQDLIARVDGMEKLCHCGKGKARERPQEVPSVLGSPLELGRGVSKDSSSHWGRGPLETGGNMSGTLNGQDPFTWHVSTRHISGTCVMSLAHVPYM